MRSTNSKVNSFYHSPSLTTSPTCSKKVSRNRRINAYSSINFLQTPQRVNTWFKESTAGGIEARSNTALASPLFKKKGKNILKLKSVTGTGWKRGLQNPGNPTALSTLSQVSINKPQLTHFPHSPIVEQAWQMRESLRRSMQNPQTMQRESLASTILDSLPREVFH